MGFAKRTGAAVIAAAMLATPSAAFADDTYDSTWKMAHICEEEGDYESAADYYEKWVNFAKPLGDETSTAEEKVKSYRSALDIYKLTSDTVVDYGAKLEPKGGVYFGQNIEQTASRDSMVLIYQEYGDTGYFGWLKEKLSAAKKAGKKVELALNFPDQGSQLDEIISDSSYLPKLMDVLSGFKSLDIFLRIGAEANTWTDKADADEYKRAFRKIASAARDVSDNIAIVWSMSQASDGNIDMDDYYPGDDVVDWVGISAYAVKYFNGEDSDGRQDNDFLFHAGDSADPIRIVDEICTRYGDRKPIMLAEGGSARETSSSGFSAVYNDWAMQNMKRMYSVTMMKYPEIKLAAYFNKLMTDETTYFNFYGISSLEQTYRDMTSQPWFIQNGEESAKSFDKIEEDATITVSGSVYEVYAMPYVFGDTSARVVYYIDGERNDSTNEAPYKTTLDISGLSEGTHEMKAVLKSGETEVITKTYTLNKTSGGSGSGEVTSPTATTAPTTEKDPVTGFTDISDLNVAQHAAVEYVAENGIVNGYDDGTFKPYGKITRAEFTTMVCRANDYTLRGGCAFDDAKDHWASKYIKACVDRGAVNGVTDTEFSPDTNVSVPQASKIMTVCEGLISGDKKYPDTYIGVAADYNLYDNTMYLETVQSRTGTTAPAVWQYLESEDYELTRIDVAVMFYNLENR